MSKNIKIMPTGFHYFFAYKESKIRTPLDLVNEYKIKKQWSEVLQYVKEKIDEYLKEHLIDLCEKYNYKKSKLILVVQFTLNNNILEKVLIRVMTQKNKNVPNGYFCGDTRLLEIKLSENDYNFKTLDTSSLIDGVFENFVKKDISIKILMETIHRGKRYHNFFIKFILKCRFIVEENRNKKYNNKLVNCCSGNIQEHYIIFKKVLFILVKTGLLHDKKKYGIRIFYYQSLGDNAVWEFSTKIDDKINISEKWSKNYLIKNDVKDIFKALCDCKMVDDIIQEYDILSISTAELKELMVYSNTILY